MSGFVWLDWAALAISLHNMIVLLWLGLTVLLNAERRGRRGGPAGINLIGASLLLAGIFFGGHSVILVLGLDRPDARLDFWWHLLWIPAVCLPYGWYLAALWYSGFWDGDGARVRSRHQPWLMLTGILTIAIAVYLALVNPLPSLARAGDLRLADMAQVSGIPVLVLVYIVDLLLCSGLALAALRVPGPERRVMGNLARSRARPWFIGTGLCLVALSCLVAVAMVWLSLNGSRAWPLDHATTQVIAGFDLAAAALIAGGTILIGQAVAHYEVFTGKVLPLRGLIRHWRNAVILAIGYSVVVSASLVIQVRVIYIVLLTTVVMTVFYALFSWRSFAERDSYIRDLRPFVTSQHLYDHLLQETPSPVEIDAATPFAALCRDVLNARTAQLLAVGPLAPLVPSLAFPEGAGAPPQADLAAFGSPQTMCIPLNSADGALWWAVPLWSERGLIGILYLGEKRDNGLYAQEEIEIARASGERLIDTCASAALARRLMVLQRQRLAETQVLDRRARRVLHDDVLPRLHAAMLGLNDQSENRQEVELLGQVHRQISDLLRDLPAGTAPEITRLGLAAALEQSIRNEWAGDFDRVEWACDPEAAERAVAIAPLTAEVVYYAAREAVRNAARHGRDTSAARPLHVWVRLGWQAGLAITIEDDGVGLKESGPSQAGGQGLALHSAMLAIVGGTLVVEPHAGGGTRVILTLRANGA